MKNSDLILNLLDISEDVPLTGKEMAKNMAVTFHPVHRHSDSLDAFVEKLKKNLINAGVEIVPYNQALNSEGKVKPGIIIIEQGEGKDEDLAIKTVSTLYHNPIVGIFEGDLQIPENPTLQETLDSIVSVLAWNLAHVPIFVQEEDWTICTMNGSIIECDNWRSPAEDILYSLVPKLSAQVVPPKREEIVYREGKFDAIEMGYGDYIDDFMSAATVWRENGLMLAHTSIEDLEYRNRFYKRIVSRYLDHRTGMSYGFLVKQLPTEIEPAVEKSSAPDYLKSHNWDQEPVAEFDDQFYLRLEQPNREWIVKLPDVWLLSTRSGCNKTDLNPKKDILRLGLHDGQITLDTPPKSSKEECRPSYDTYAILAHAVGNVLTASMIMADDPNAIFPNALINDGLSISHWHGYPDKTYPLPGYITHGEENPPVSCSTPQSAAYAFVGKLKPLDLFPEPIGQYRGDIHIEPHHGTNISGAMTLTESAKWVDEMHKSRITDDLPVEH